MTVLTAMPVLNDLNFKAVPKLLAESSLKHFVQQAWHIVEPVNPYSHNWHIEALCDHLEAALRGDIRNLLVTMPPRAMKSLTISVFFPAWAWIHRPDLRFLYASYAQSLAIEHSMATRRVIESDWYQARWGDRFSMAEDDNLKTRFSNDRRGYRLATSVGAAVTGFGGDVVLADDPHNVQQAESDAVRQSTLTWWDQAMSTRLNNPRTGVRIIVMQRVHEDDLAGHVASDPAWTHLNLPMEYEPTDYVSPIGWSDPRTVDGELLWPERMDAAFVETQKRTLGSYAYAGQYQQRPAPAEGGILKAHWFGRYSAPMTHYYGIVQAWDTAFKTTEGADYSACVTIGIGGQGFDVLDVFHARLEFPDLERTVQTMHAVWSARYPGVPFSVLVEDKASGQSLIQAVRRWAGSTMNIIPVAVPHGQGKEQRVHEISPVVEAGRVRIPISTPERQIPWLDDALHEWTTFPFVKHDDVTDAFAIAVRRAAGIGEAFTNATDSSAFAPTADDPASFRRRSLRR